MYAFSRIAESAPDLISPFADIVCAALTDQNALVRIYALETIGKLKRHDSLSIAGDVMAKLKHDNSEVWVYRGSDFVNVTVGDVAEIISM
jgi:hypothetical protein